MLSLKFFCRECRPLRTGTKEYLPLDSKWNKEQMLSTGSICIDWGVFYVQNSLKLGHFLTPLVPYRCVTLPKPCCSSWNPTPIHQFSEHLPGKWDLTSWFSFQRFDNLLLRLKACWVGRSGHVPCLIPDDSVDVGVWAAREMVWPTIFCWC